MSFKENDSSNEINKESTGFLPTERNYSESRDKEHNLSKNQLFALICEENFSNNSIDKINHQVTSHLSDNFGITYSFIIAPDEDEEHFIIKSFSGNKNSFLEQKLISRPQFGQANYTFQTATSLFTKEIIKEQSFLIPDFLDKLNIQSLLTIQIPGKQSPYGVLCLAWSSPMEEDPEIRTFSESIANILSAVVSKKLSEESLKDSEKNYRDLFNHSSELIYIIDEKGFFIDVNQTATHLHGYSREEILGNTVNFLTDSTRQKPESASGYLEKGWQKEKHPFEWWGKKKNGESFIQELYIRRGNFFGKESFIVHGRDITERKQAEEKLRTSEENYRTLLQALNDGVLYTDNDGKIIFYNKSFSALSGYKIHELLHKDAFEIFPIKENGKTDMPHETILTTKDGLEKNVLINKTVVKNNEGIETGCLSTWMDITDQRYTEKELETKKQELNTFLYKVSHDLKGPLTSMMGLVHLAEDEIKDPLASNYFSMVKTLAEKLDTILIDLSDLTRIQIKKVEPSQINVHEMLSDLCEQIYSKENPGNFTIDIKVDSNLDVNNDINLLNIIAGNLIENAIIFRQRTLENPQLIIEAEKEQDFLTLKFIDNGSGIENEKIPRIYEMFYRGSMHSKGTGMGLFLVNSALKKIDGKIEIDSTPGEGTTANVKFPLN